MSTLQFYTERAADCRRQADVTNLENVRARCLNAADAWEEMADRVRRAQIFREGDAARKAGVARREVDAAELPNN